VHNPPNQNPFSSNAIVVPNTLSILALLQLSLQALTAVITTAVRQAVWPTSSSSISTPSLSFGCKNTTCT
jgi:hypothetical protein